MPKRPSHHRVKIHAVYTVAEAAEAIGVHRQTVLRWVSHGGLNSDRVQKPWLIRGDDLKAWLMARREEGRSRLQPGELYCLPCRAPKRPALDVVDLRLRSATSGVLVGLCPDCERLIHRIVRADEVARVAGSLAVAIP